MKLQTLVGLLAAAAFALPIAALGQAKPAAGAAAAAAFKVLDKNKDGFITPDEAAGSPYAADFNVLDKNRDGKLSPQEHAAALAASAGSGAPAKK